jgi:hypothetical protein
VVQIRLCAHKGTGPFEPKTVKSSTQDAIQASKSTVGRRDRTKPEE